MYQYQVVWEFLEKEFPKFRHLPIKWSFDVGFTGEVQGYEEQFKISMEDGLHFPEVGEERQSDNQMAVVALQKSPRTYLDRFELSETNEMSLSKLKESMERVLKNHSESQQRMALMFGKRIEC